MAQTGEYAKAGQCKSIAELVEDKKWSGWRDLNSRPFDPQSNALSRLRHIPNDSRKYNIDPFRKNTNRFQYCFLDLSVFFPGAFELRRVQIFWDFFQNRVCIGGNMPYINSSLLIQTVK